MRKLIIGLSCLLATGLSQAEPSSKVAWTAETLNLVESGNPEKGKQLAETCASCHGSEGISSNPAFPSLAGQLPTYLYRQLRDYKDGSRQNPLMQNFANGLSDQDMADLAAWYAQLPPPVRKRTGEKDFEKIMPLVIQGDSKRIIPPCYVCHGTHGEGEKIDTPRIAGQSVSFLEQVLKDYKTGIRHNDIYGRMRLIAEQLTDEEIKGLAEYYSTLQP